MFGPLPDSGRTAPVCVPASLTPRAVQTLGLRWRPKNCRKRRCVFLFHHHCFPPLHASRGEPSPDLASVVESLLGGPESYQKWPRSSVSSGSAGGRQAGGMSLGSLPDGGRKSCNRTREDARAKETVRQGVATRKRWKLASRSHFTGQEH